MPAPPPTPRLAFREMTLDDLDDMAALLGDPQVMRYYPSPKSREEALAWIAWNQRLYREHGVGLWLLTLRDTGEFVGDCGLTPQQVDGAAEVEVGYHVRAALQGGGLATEAAAACRDYARDVLGVGRLIAIIDPRNRPSQRVAEKLGLVVERDSDNHGRWSSAQRIYTASLQLELTRSGMRGRWQPSRWVSWRSGSSAASWSQTGSISQDGRQSPAKVALCRECDVPQAACGSTLPAEAAAWKAETPVPAVGPNGHLGTLPRPWGRARPTPVVADVTRCEGSPSPRLLSAWARTFDGLWQNDDSFVALTAMVCYPADRIPTMASSTNPYADRGDLNEIVGALGLAGPALGLST